MFPPVLPVEMTGHATEDERAPGLDVNAHHASGRVRFTALVTGCGCVVQDHVHGLFLCLPVIQ